MQAVEVDAGWIVGWGGINLAAGRDAVALHGGDDAELDDCGRGHHEEDEQGLGEEELTAGGPGAGAEDQSGEREKKAADLAHGVEGGEGPADDEASFTSGGKDAEGHRGDDEGEEDEATDPDDDGEQSDGAESDWHVAMLDELVRRGRGR